MPPELQRPGNIFLSVTTTADRARVISTARVVEQGFISYASLGLVSAIPAPLVIWGDLRLLRDEALTTYIMGTIAAGYISGQFSPMFTGRIPLLPGDSIQVGALSSVAVQVTATIRFERA